MNGYGSASEVFMEERGLGGGSLGQAKERVSGSKRSEFEMRKRSWSSEEGGPQGGSKVDR